MIPLTTEQKPKAFEKVLCWDERRSFTIGHWIQRSDVEDGRMWCINGASGGLGTRAEVRPPTHWQRLPPEPGEEAHTAEPTPTWYGKPWKDLTREELLDYRAMAQKWLDENPCPAGYDRDGLEGWDVMRITMETATQCADTWLAKIK